MVSLKVIALLKGKGFMQLKSPGQLVDERFHAAHSRVGSARKGHGVMQHGQEQRLGGMGADNLALEQH